MEEMGCQKVWSMIICLVLLVLTTVHGAKRRDDPVGPTTTIRPSPPPPCYKRWSHAGLAGTGVFRVKKNNESPGKCAEACSKIHDDQEEKRTCRAFEYNVRNGLCRFFERNSQDDNVRIVDKVNFDLYELDELCLAQRNAPPTPPPRVSACREGMRPLMERVSGFYLKASGLSFKQISEKQCVQECLKDQTPIRHENYKCTSVSYNSGNQVCTFLSQIARPLDKRGPPLTPDSRYNYYSKLCISSAAVAKCKGSITRFVGKQLVAMTDAKITTSDYSECVSACLTADAKLGFNCRSGMFQNNVPRDNCILNYSDHYEEHTLFIDGETQHIDYFSLRSCQW